MNPDPTKEAYLKLQGTIPAARTKRNDDLGSSINIKDLIAENKESDLSNNITTDSKQKTRDRKHSKNLSSNRVSNSADHPPPQPNPNPITPFTPNTQPQPKPKPKPQQTPTPKATPNPPDTDSQKSPNKNTKFEIIDDPETPGPLFVFQPEIQNSEA
jgi:Dullard-like phosphatase family protein